MAATLPDGTTVELRPLAQGICARYRVEFPDEEERYGDAGHEWCVHDNQHILHWAVLEVRGSEGLLARQIAWLSRVLAARAFPLERLRRDLELAAEAARAEHPNEPRLAEVLRDAARGVSHG